MSRFFTAGAQKRRGSESSREAALTDGEETIMARVKRFLPVGGCSEGPPASR